MPAAAFAGSAEDSFEMTRARRRRIIGHTDAGSVSPRAASRCRHARIGVDAQVFAEGAEGRRRRPPLLHHGRRIDAKFVSRKRLALEPFRLELAHHQVTVGRGQKRQLSYFGQMGRNKLSAILLNGDAIRLGRHSLSGHSLPEGAPARMECQGNRLPRVLLPAATGARQLKTFGTRKTCRPFVRCQTQNSTAERN